MKKSRFLCIYSLHTFIFSLFFYCFFVNKIFASEPSDLYHKNILVAKLAKEKINQQNVLNNKAYKKTPNLGEYFVKNYDKILYNNTIKENFLYLKKNFSKYKDRIAKKFKNKKRIDRQKYWWSLLDFFFQSPEAFLFMLISLLVAFLLWLLFSALGVAIAFEIIFLISLVITLIGYIVVLWS